MYESLILNGIYTVEPLDIGQLKCYKALLKCSYDVCKRRLHGVFIYLLSNKYLATYELREESRESCLVRIYVKDEKVVDIVRNKLSDILQNTFTYVGEVSSSYSAIENFFDLLVDVAFREAGFENIKGRGAYLDKDGQRMINKRTIIKIEQDSNGNTTYHGVLFIDYSIISKSSLADELLEKLGIDDFTSLKENNDLRLKALEIANSYIGETILTLTKRGAEYKYLYGKIVGVEVAFAREKKLDTGQLIYDLWIERYRSDEKVRSFIGAEPSESEFPLFKVEVKEGSRRHLIYPPSLLKLVKVSDRPDPATRWDIIRKIMRVVEENMKKIYKSLTGKELSFRYIKYSIDSQHVGIRLNFYTGSDIEKPFWNTVVKLRYRDRKGNERSSTVSPLYAFSQQRSVPYADRQKLDLLVVYPSTLDRSEVEEFANYLSSLFKELNFGSITGCNYYSYTYDPANLSESLNSLEKTLQQIVSSYSNTECLPLVIIPGNEDFYRMSKDVASSRGFHTQLVKIETFNRAMECIQKIKGSSIDAQAKQYIENALRFLIANICGGIYVEYLIQKSKALGKVSGPLTWILDEPADGNAQSMYVGLDISTKKGVSGAAFILLDPYGKLIDAKIVQLKSEVISYQEYYDILRYMVSKARDQGLKRIVILRDGIPRTPLELGDCLQAFDRVTNDLGYRTELDYVAAIEHSTVRIFGSNGKTKVNPIQGTYTYLYKLKHFGYNAHEVLVVASKPGEDEEDEEETAGTARPIILRVYELGKTYDVGKVKNVAEEYLALTRLNFWNIRTGASKLALPIKMADILSYMLSMGIQIKV